MTSTPAKSSGRTPAGKKGSLVIIAAIIFGLFAFPATAMAKEEKPPKVIVCDQKKDGYKIKMVKPDKVEKRLEKHEEDGVPGGDVPGMVGYMFSEACVPVPKCLAPANLTIMGRGFYGGFGEVTTHVDGVTTQVAYGYKRQVTIPASLLPGEFHVSSNDWYGYQGVLHIECGANMRFNPRTGQTFIR